MMRATLRRAAIGAVLAALTACTSGARSSLSASTSTLSLPTTIDTTPPPVGQCATASHAPAVAPVLVLRRDVQRGEKGSDVVGSGGIACALLSAEFKPATAIDDPAAIADLYAIAPLSNGQVVVIGMFATNPP